MRPAWESGSIAGHLQPVHLAVAVAAAVEAGVNRIDVNAGQFAGDAAPAATVKAGGVQQQHRVAFPGPLGDLEGDSGQRHRVGPGW